MLKVSIEIHLRPQAKHAFQWAGFVETRKHQMPKK